MKPRTDDEMTVLAELNAGCYGCEDWTPEEREDYERWLDEIAADGPEGYFEPSAVETEIAPDDLPF